MSEDSIDKQFAQTVELCNYLLKNKIALKGESMLDIFAKLIAADNPKKEEKIKPIKIEKIDIPKTIRKSCQENKDIFILSMHKNFSFLLKRKEEIITRILGEGTMNPVEKQTNVIYFDCFALCWALTKKEEPIPQLDKLKEYGFPVHHVDTEYDIQMAIIES